MRVELQIAGVDLDGEVALAAVAEHLSDALWSCVDGAVLAEIQPAGTSIAGAVVEFARRVASWLPGSTVLRVHRDLVAASDIAARTGFSREAVRKWATGAVGFPQPLDTVGAGSTGTRVWLWSEVAQWVRDRYQLAVEDDGPSEALAAEIDAHLLQVPSVQGWQSVPMHLPAISAQVMTIRQPQVRIEAASARGLGASSAVHDEQLVDADA